ncbi:ADM_collapsed_G0054940.mRNA.1.CDS.1 [Saccharomyces cerevisiae]|nr:ADM_collapsed_G0054940.mRNA.1.CDS.1 [Saccharomyces cerevisiae]
MSSVESSPISRYEDEVFPLSFSNVAFEPPMLSHSPDRSTYADDFSQSYQQELLTFPLSYPIVDESECTHTKDKTDSNIITSTEDDCMFRYGI